MNTYKDATSPRDRTRTKQNYRTPENLVRAVVARFGPIAIDLAASDGDEVVPLVDHITPEQDSLARPWPTRRHPHGVLWLNPPYADIAVWAEKCADWAQRATPGPVLCLLVPLSADSGWWRSWVRGRAHVLALESRPIFRGEVSPYPKPMALIVYDPRYPVQGSGVEGWNWKGIAR